MTGWQPATGQMITRWAAEITPENAWQMYPRPQLVRAQWRNLNGLWDYAIAPLEMEMVLAYSGQILVPFPLESALSGVKRALQPEERLWYRRRFTIPEEWHGQRVLLHIGASDWQTSAWLNGQWLGMHQGGYLPFQFELTRWLHAGENELILAVWDPTDTHWQARGKQVLKPRSIWYTAASGIWQTVWLEAVPETYLAGLKITPELDSSSVLVQARLDGPEAKRLPVRVTVLAQGKPGANGETFGGEALHLIIPNPHPWNPDDPYLYDLVVEAGSDRVESYFGMRKFSLGTDAQGRARLCLNNQPLFQYGPLDQGYWPDGLYTPPSEAAMRFDLEQIKALGCNMLRKHVKVEPARYYYDCDRLGLIVWQDMPSGAREVDNLPALLIHLFGSRRKDHHYRLAGRGDPEARQDFRRELQEMVDHLHNFTCIGMWVPFNEGWGQFDARAAAEWLADYDPTRPVDHASGWYDQCGGNCTSLHVYFKALQVVKPEKKRAVVLSEFGGYTLKLEEHLWNPQAEFGYRKFAAREALTEAYIELLDKQLKPWINAGLSAAIYTQTTDVEIELNGYLTYDRAVEKMDFGRVRVAHEGLFMDGEV
jgi:beta-galactosidase/beta-glucuronidase